MRVKGRLLGTAAVAAAGILVAACGSSGTVWVHHSVQVVWPGCHRH